MYYLIFNEESKPYASKEQAQERFPIFLEIIKEASKNYFETLRISENIDRSWFGLPLINGYLVNDWVREQENDRRLRIKSILIDRTSQPQIPDGQTQERELAENSEFWLKIEPERKTPSLGNAYLLEQIGVSLYSKDCWREKEIDLIHYQILEDGEEEKEVRVINCGSFENWVEVFENVQREREQNVLRTRNLWENRERSFPNLVFCGRTETQIKGLRCSNKLYSQLWEVLSRLNTYCEGENKFSTRDLYKKTGLNVSGESNQLINNQRLASMRRFRTPNGREYFFDHIKNFVNYYRLHILLRAEQRAIYIGYFGPHLPTVTNPT